MSLADIINCSGGVIQLLDYAWFSGIDLSVHRASLEKSGALRSVEVNGQTVLELL